MEHCRKLPMCLRSPEISYFLFKKKYALRVVNFAYRAIRQLLYYRRHYILYVTNIILRNQR